MEKPGTRKKIDLEGNPRTFWKEIEAMMGRKKRKWVGTLKKENGFELR